jgi:uncharacterized membrane protein YgcG
MFPEIHQEETWEQRCACIATLLCCRQQVEKPAHEGRRPPLKNIAELSAGILSHIDIDTTDLAAAIVLTSAAQQRRRRLRIAKALLPVYRTLREGQRERTEPQRQQQLPHAAADGVGDQERGEDFMSSAFDPGSLLEEREGLEEEEESDATVEDESEVENERSRRRRRGRGGRREKGRKRRAGGRGRVRFYDDDDPYWVPSDSKLTRQLTLARQVSEQQQQQQQLSQQLSQQSVPPSPSQPQTPPSAEAKSLDLTTDNLAAINTVQKLEQLKEETDEEIEEEDLGNSIKAKNIVGEDSPILDISPPTANPAGVEGMSQAAAELCADEITSTPAPPGETIDQLASAIQEEVEMLGEGPVEESVLTIKQQDSLDLSSIRIDPSNPMIWIQPDGLIASDFESESEGEGGGGALVNVSAGAKVLHPSVEREVTVRDAGDGGGGGGGGSGNNGKEESIDEDRSSKTDKLSRNSATPSAADREEAASALAAVVEEAKEESSSSSSNNDARFDDANNKDSSRPTSSSAAQHDLDPENDGEEEHHKLPLERQITLQHPTVITPSAHVENFTGPLSPEALAEIYAGRHESVPAAKLTFASSFLRYAYAAYALHSRMEHPNRFLDWFCFSPPNPQEMIFKSLSALGEMVGDESVEILHLNCSNRVLSHLPYLIALDHAERAVVIALRGTIGITDLVTDAVVHPDQIDDWLPNEVAEKMGGTPALAHAGMVAAARAVFEDMTERGILRELVHGEGEEEAIHDLTRGSRGQKGKDGHTGDSGGGGTRIGVGEGGSSGGGGSSPSGQSRAPQQQNIQRDNDYTGLQPQYHHYEEYETYRKESGGGSFGGNQKNQHLEEGDDEATGAGKAVGDLMRKKVQEEGWQLVVVGHSLGAGAASLISLKLRHYYPQLKCLAFSCPGGLVNKKLSHAMTPFCTTIAVGKDAIPRSSVATIARLMDELVTSLARCKQPKIRVLFLPWWRRHSQQFKDLFYDYSDIPGEAAAALLKYYESRRRLGQPIEMYPPGKVIFLRPIKSQSRLGIKKTWDAIYIAPEDLMGEGILVSPNMLKDHLCSTAYDALNEAREKAEAVEERREQEAQRRDGIIGGVWRGAGRAVRGPWNMMQGAAAHALGGGQPHVRARQGSLDQALINAV